MLLATFALTTSQRARRLVLQALADAMVNVNRLWLREQLDRGARPPVSLAMATAPFAPRGVVYVTHHGDEVGASRVYQDGATAMATGRATCFDVACYDAAASSMLLAVPMTVKVEPIVDTTPGAPLRCHAWMLDARGTMLDPTRAMRKVGA
jgi:hypothetical protein